MVHAVSASDGQPRWPVTPNPHRAPGRPYEFEGSWPVVAEQHGVVFVRMNHGIDLIFQSSSWSHSMSGIRQRLQNEPEWKNLFALDLETGEEKFIPAVGRACGFSQLVAFSCKCRAFCPSCVARRMADTGVHLEQRVLPEVPVRHWICSFRWGLRALLGYDKQICAQVLAAVIKELNRSLKCRAKELLGLSTIQQALTGAVAEEIARRVADRVDAILKKHGRSLDPEESDPEPTEIQLEHPALAACYDAAALGVGVSSSSIW